MPTRALPKSRRDLGDLLLDKSAKALPIWLVAGKDDAHLKELTDAQRNWLEARGWSPKPGAVLLLPDAGGGIGGALLGVGSEDWATQSPLLPGALPGALPPGDYRFASTLPDPELGDARLARRLLSLRPLQIGERRKAEAARAARRRRSRRAFRRLPRRSIFGRDLINIPANDLGPAELETAAREIGAEHGATVKVTEGSSLLADNFPMIHAVGRASDRAPRLIDLRWGSERAPKVTIVGKGICFDTGGLDIKPGSAMALMKKDMGGAASALAFAHLVMQAKLPLRLRVLIPAADNSIAGNAFRPGDVLRSRNGMTVEIGNTDAEGRLVLADALEPRRRGGAGLPHHHRHAHRRGARRARAGPAAALYRRRRSGGGAARERRKRRRSSLAHAAVGALRQDCSRATSPT